MHTSLEKAMAPHSSTLAWKIPQTEEPGGLLSIGLQRVGHDWSDLASMHALEKEMATHSSILAWRIPGTEEPGGLPSMGSHRLRHDWSDLAAAEAGQEESVYADSLIFFFLCDSFTGPRNQNWLKPQEAQLRGKFWTLKHWKKTMERNKVTLGTLTWRPA